MSLPLGFNFRQTVGFVTDVAPAVFIGASSTYLYPFSAGGQNVGWDSTADIDSRNRLNTNDARLAGIVFEANNGAAAKVFRLDLPAAGTYNIRVALGDASASQTIRWELLDNTTQLALINNVTTSAANRFLDATGVERTNANWAANNVAITKTFATTTLFFKIGGSSAGNSSTIAHFYIESAAAAAFVKIAGSPQSLAGYGGGLVG